MTDRERNLHTAEANANTPHSPRRRASRPQPPSEVTHWRIIIAGVFLLALLTQIALATFLRVRGDINPEDYAPLIVKLLTIYSAPFGVILGGIFAAKRADRKAGRSEVWVVLALSCVWNGLLLVRYLIFTFGSSPDTVKDLSGFQDTVLPAGSFLTSAALAYLYGGHRS